jgi:hypothetical protein
VRRLAVLVLLAAACGGGGGGASSTPDAAPVSDAPTGGDATSFPACAEFSAAAVQVPAHVTSMLAGADLASPAACASIDAPFGVESAGPDQVIPLKGLVVGATYVVRVTSADDLSFYVATGCSTATGPAADQCLLFEDGTSGDREVGTFTATASTAYVIVDFYASHPPSSLAFTLDAYAQACATNAQCTGATPACAEGQCVQCVTSFDCTDVTAPVCSANETCVAGVDACLSDGTDEPANDGPAGATQLVPDGAGHASVLGKLCSTPSTEEDFFAFDVTTLGETWDLSLGWSGSRDLDLRVFDATGKRHGMSFWEQPERARLTYLPIGRYFVQIHEFASTADPSPVTYTLSAQRTFGAPCTSSAQCAAEYRNQIYRGQCSAGACIEIAGNGAVPQGGACDSQADCASGLSCPSFFFVANSDTRETCSPSCTDDTECTPLGAGHVCSTYLTNNFCVQSCTTDDQCPTAIDTSPTSGPWYRLHCDIPTGRCLP